MPFDNNKAAIFILLIEDEIEMATPLKEQLKRKLEKYGFPVVDIAQTLVDAEKKIKMHPYAAIHIDLRLPKSAGGVVDGTPAGLQSGEVIQRYLPLALPIIWSNHAHKHAKAAHFAGVHECPYWSKGSPPPDTIPELPHYTSRDGTDAFVRMLDLWSSEDLQNDEISWAERFFRRGRALLPEGMAITAAHLSSSLKASTEAQAQLTLTGISDFAEWIQRWLWCVATAVLESGTLLRKGAVWPPLGNNRYLMRGVMEDLLADRLQTWAGSKLSNHQRLLLRFLNIADEVPNTLNIIDALGLIRKQRNDWAHGRSAVGKLFELVESGPALRVLMQAAHFLAAWPLVTEVEPVGNRWRLTCVRGQFPWPKEEWDLNLPANFRCRPGHVYQVWPNEDGHVGLLDLWPWLECRPDEGGRINRLWQVLGPIDGQSVFESNFNEFKELKFIRHKPCLPYRHMTDERWRKLEEIAKSGK